MTAGPRSDHVTKAEARANDDAGAAEPRALRVDAAKNRERILDAAETTFAAEGVSAPIDAVAQ
ncbi:MAG: TetR/AcrR family transcriptional regulator, partial [Solirubrobacteraceae bacterium]